MGAAVGRYLPLCSGRYHCHCCHSRILIFTLWQFNLDWHARDRTDGWSATAFAADVDADAIVAQTKFLASTYACIYLCTRVSVHIRRLLGWVVVSSGRRLTPPALHSFGGWLLLDAFIYKLFFFFGFCLFFFFSVKKNASQRIAETYGDGNALCMMLYYVCMHSGLCLCTNSCAARSRLLLIDHNERQ